MIEKRKFPRLRFAADCVLFIDGQTYEGKVINVSLGGAMVSLNYSAVISQDEQCLLKIMPGNNEPPDEIKATVVYASYSCIGVSFLEFDKNSHPRLYAQLEELGLNPEKYRVSYP